MKTISKARIQQVIEQVTDQCMNCAALEVCTTKPSECTVRTMVNKKAIVTNVTNVIDDNCFISGDEVKTTSLKIAEVFGKRHDHILRKLQTIDCSTEFRLLNYGESSYINEQGKKQPMYEMTKDGFMFIVMGFTGKKAAKLKETYIATFNQMAEQLRSGAGFAIPKTHSGALQLAADQQRQLEHHNINIEAVKSALNDLNKAFNNLT